MGITVNEVLERAKSEFLLAGNTDSETWDTIDTAMDASQLTMSLAGHITSGVPPDSVLEADDGTMEMVLNKSTDSSDLTLQQRGWMESGAASHDSGTRFILDPVWPRIVLYNALKGVISSLKGYGLYLKALSTSLTYSSVAPVSLPAGAWDVLSVHWLDSTLYRQARRGEDFDILYDAGATVDAPPQLQFYGYGMQGASMRVTYKKDFTSPDDVFAADTSSPPLDSVLDVDLDDCGVPTSLQPHMATAVAASVLQGRDVPILDNERVRAALANQGIAPGTRSGVARNLMSAFLEHVVIARNNQLVSNPTRITEGNYA